MTGIGEQRPGRPDDLLIAIRALAERVEAAELTAATLEHREQERQRRQPTAGDSAATCLHRSA